MSVQRGRTYVSTVEATTAGIAHPVPAAGTLGRLRGSTGRDPEGRGIGYENEGQGAQG